MSKTLVIVESPTKARTIEKFLGKDFVVRASYGHVRDLPSNAEEIPAAVKKEKWARIGVNVDADFEPLYVVSAKKKQNITELKKLMKDASEVLLATDEDREGESISWHLCEILNPKIPYKRLVFHEITREAIDEALKSPRAIDDNLVKAQETRRIIDRLFGYTVSPVLWKKMKPRLSAGRVQSVALRLLVERERERVTFRSAGYWDLKALFSKEGTEENSGRFEAELAQLKGKRIATGKDFDPKTGRLTDPAAVVLLDAKSCSELREKLLQGKAKVTSVEEKDYTSKPYAPFTTSTLQQEASRKLGFAARRTMQVAQMLYENGLITYMRTDSTNLSDEALRGARTLIEREYGADYMPAQPRLYRTSVKNAQEAHEAIRPAGEAFASMDFVREKFGQEAFRLYELIWKRTVASQMKDSRGKRVSAQIELGDALFRASGTTIEFPGYLRAYVEGSDDPEAELADREKFLPKLKVGETLKTLGLESLEHTTQPPARFTEGSLIKELERLGIGRPSTWATIVDIVLSRDYAFKKGSALVPTFLAMAVISLMERFFADVVDYAYTAHMEDDLDAISRGEAESLKYLKKFYFGDGNAGLKNLVEAGGNDIDPRDVCGLPIGEDEKGNKVEVRIGRFGPFLSNGESRASVPDGVCPDEMTVEKAVQMLAQSAKGPESIGQDPVSGLSVYIKNGRFGPYLQLGEMQEGGDKPKMASLLPGMSFEGLSMETAMQLLSLPREVGINPDNGEKIMAANGRFGPYIKCGVDTRSVPAGEMTVLNITLDQAMALLREPKKRGRGAQPASLKEIGKHPTSEKMITLKSGRYGPYVTDGEVNASLARGADPSAITLDEAVGLLTARAAAIEANGGVSRRPKRGARVAKAPAAKAKKEPKKAAPKKPAKKAAKAKKA